MFLIDDKKKMTVVKGDTAIFTVSVDNHTFSKGDTAYFTVRKSVGESPIEIRKVITDFDKNTFKVFLDKNDTDITVGTYLYDIQLNLNDGRVDTVILPTKFTILGGVTID